MEGYTTREKSFGEKGSISNVLGVGIAIGDHNVMCFGMHVRGPF